MEELLWQLWEWLRMSVDMPFSMQYKLCTTEYPFSDCSGGKYWFPLSWPLFHRRTDFPYRPLVTVGICLFSLAVLFQLVTLPVEINASSRALKMLESTGILGAMRKKVQEKYLQRQHLPM